MTIERIDAVTGEILPSLAECEATIERGVRSYIEAGEALRTIRDSRLYRETFATFEDYCRERWGWERRRAYQLIEAADVVQNIAQLGAPVPANDAQARELTGLPAETAAQIMRTAVETGQNVTARIIRETRVQITQPKETQKETPMTAAPSRLAIPQPPKYGGNRHKHRQVLSNVIVSAQGLCIVADEIQALDGSINSEEAASYADDLSRIIRSLKRVQRLLTKEV